MGAETVEAPDMSWACRGSEWCGLGRWSRAEVKRGAESTCASARGRRGGGSEARAAKAERRTECGPRARTRRLVAVEDERPVRRTWVACCEVQGVVARFIGVWGFLCRGGVARVGAEAEPARLRGCLRRHGPGSDVSAREGGRRSAAGRAGGARCPAGPERGAGGTAPKAEAAPIGENVWAGLASTCEKRGPGFWDQNWALRVPYLGPVLCPRRRRGGDDGAVL